MFHDLPIDTIKIIFEFLKEDKDKKNLLFSLNKFLYEQLKGANIILHKAYKINKIYKSKIFIATKIIIDIDEYYDNFFELLKSKKYDNSKKIKIIMTRHENDDSLQSNSMDLCLWLLCLPIIKINDSIKKYRIQNFFNSITKANNDQKFKHNDSQLNFSIVEIQMNLFFNIDTIQKIPTCIEKLTLDCRHNSHIDIEFIPDNVTHLKIGNWNDYIYKYPPNITHLTFGNKFNTFHGKNLPINLKYLKFGHSYNKFLSLTSVEKLETLILGNNFNQFITYYPPELRKLVFGHNYNQTTRGLPDKLNYLQFGHNYSQQIINLPNSLKYLIFGDSYNKDIKKFPTNLKYLKFGKYFNRTIDNLPDSLEILHLGLKFEKVIKNFPKSLKKIYFHEIYNETIRNNNIVFPNNLDIRFHTTS